MLGKALKTFSPEIEDLNWHTQSSKDILKNLNPDYRESLTPNAVVVGNMIPSYFPCCPQEKSENPLQEYFTRLQPGNVYYMNSKYKVLVQKIAFVMIKLLLNAKVAMEKILLSLGVLVSFSMKMVYMFMIYTKPVLKKKVQINILLFFRAKIGLAVRCLMIIARN